MKRTTEQKRIDELEQTVERQGQIIEALLASESNIRSNMEALEGSIELLHGSIESATERHSSSVDYEAEERRREDYYLEDRISRLENDVSSVQSEIRYIR